jgi:nucleoid DNA-binding protein
MLFISLIVILFTRSARCHPQQPKWSNNNIGNKCERYGQIISRSSINSHLKLICLRYINYYVLVVTIKIKELIDVLETKNGSTKAEADLNIAAIIDIITTTLKKGDNISLVGFGSFEVRKRAARTGRNLPTGKIWLVIT